MPAFRTLFGSEASTKRRTFARIAGNNRICRHIPGHNAAGAHNGVLAHAGVGRIVAPEPIEAPLTDDRVLNLPVRLGLQTTSGAWSPADRSRW